LLYFFLLISFFFYSCKKDIETNLEQTWIFPLAYTKLDINSFLSDTLYNITENNVVKLIYNKKLQNILPEEIFEIKDINFKYTLGLQSLKIKNLSFDYQISLGQIANKDKEINGSNSTFYTTIITAHNTGQPTLIQSFGPITFDTIKINLSKYLKYLNLKKATLLIKIKNNLPFPFSNFSYIVYKNNISETLIDGNFNEILPFSEVEKTHFIQDIVLDSIINAKIIISSPGTSIPVTIDTSQNIQLSLNFLNIIIDSAIIKINNTDTLEFHDNINLNLPDSIQLYYVETKESIFNIRVYNSFASSININMLLPDVKKNNIPYSYILNVPSGTTNNPSMVTYNLDLSGYAFKFYGIAPYEQIWNNDLNNNGIIDQDTCNKLYYYAKITLNNSSEYLSLGKKDSILIDFNLISLKPKYVKGFFGYKKINFSDSLDFNIFKNLIIDELLFDNFIITINLYNQVGIKGKIYLNNLCGINSDKNIEKELIGEILNNSFIIEKPTDPLYYLNNNIQPTIKQIKIDKTNSNITDLISIIPNKFKFNISLNINENVPLPINHNYTQYDFLYDYSNVSLFFNIEAPLYFSLRQSLLQDTINIEFPNIDLNKVKNFKLIIYSYNLFPLNFDLHLYFLDGNKNKVDSICNLNISSANIISHNLNLYEETQKHFSFNFTNKRLYNLLKCKYLIYNIKINTPLNNLVKIYYNSYIKLNFVAEVEYLFKK